MCHAYTLRIHCSGTFSMLGFLNVPRRMDNILDKGYARRGKSFANLYVLHVLQWSNAWYFYLNTLFTRNRVREAMNGSAWGPRRARALAHRMESAEEYRARLRDLGLEGAELDKSVLHAEIDLAWRQQVRGGPGCAVHCLSIFQ